MQFGLDFEDAMKLWIWIGRLWPLIIVLSILGFRRFRINNPIAFIILGIFICYGVQQIVGHISAVLPVATPPEAEFNEKFAQALFANLDRTVTISLILSLAPLLWFMRILNTEKFKSINEESS